MLMIWNSIQDEGYTFNTSQPVEVNGQIARKCLLNIEKYTVSNKLSQKNNGPPLPPLSVGYYSISMDKVTKNA